MHLDIGAVNPGHRPALVLSNVAAAAVVRAGEARRLGRGQSLLLPAAIGEVVVEAPADELVGYLRKLERDVVAPFRRAGFAKSAIAGLGTLPT